MSEENARIPKSLTSFQGSFPMERRRVKLSTLNGTSFSAGENIRLRFPDRALVDMSTWDIHFNATTTGTDSALVPVSYGLIKSILFQVGGLTLGAQNNYQNQLAHAVSLASRGIEVDKANMMTRAYNNIPAGTTKDASAPVVCNYFPFTLASCGVLDTAIFPAVEADIRLEGNACLDILTTADGTYSIADVVSYVDILLPASEAYVKTMQSRLSSGGMVKKSVPSCVAFKQTQNGSNSVNCASNSLDAVLVGVKKTGWSNQAAKGAYAYNGFLEFSLSDTNANQVMHLQLANGEQYPTYGNPQNSFEHAEMTRNWAGKQSAYNFNKLFYNQTGANVDAYARDNYLSSNFVWVAQLGGEGSAVDNHGLHSGLNTMGQSNIIRVNSTNLEATDELLINCLCSSMLEAKAGGVVAFIQ